MTADRSDASQHFQQETASSGLLLDAHTLDDLEIFGNNANGPSVFKLCNFTRTEGGKEVLKRRMRTPWSEAEKIRQTQRSLTFIMQRRTAFKKMPSYIIDHVEQYGREVLLMVTQLNSVEFVLGALSLKINNERHFRFIRRGVEFGTGFIRALRDLVDDPELASPEGELAGLIEEVQALLATPRIASIPNKEIGGSSMFKVLRIDQVFRMHEKVAIARLIQLTFEIDALVSMADAMHKHGLTLPRIEEGELRVNAEGLYHPFVPEPVANPVALDQQQRLLFLTGPNMAGKTTYLRAFATALYLGHLGMGVPATQFSFVPAQRLFSSISLSDDIHGGISYFRAEALRVKAVAEAIAAGYRVVAIMDEPFKGTNVKDALDASLAIMERFATKNDCLFMFSSHLIELGERLSVAEKISSHNFEADESEGRLSFDYTLRPGVSSQRLGVRVLREEGVFDLLDE